MTVTMALGRRAQDSRVLLDGVDITHALFGVEVRAFTGEASLVILYLHAAVELTGDVDVVLRRPDCASPSSTVRDVKGVQMAQDSGT